MGPTGYPKTSLRICHYMPCNIPRDSRSHLLHSISLRLCIGHNSAENRNLVNNLKSKFSCSILQIQKSNTKANYDYFSLAIEFHNTPKPFHLSIKCHNSLKWWYTNFPRISQPPLNSRCQDSGMQHVPF
jgi:hypothetical protein